MQQEASFHESILSNEKLEEKYRNCDIEAQLPHYFSELSMRLQCIFKSVCYADYSFFSSANLQVPHLLVNTGLAHEDDSCLNCKHKRMRLKTKIRGNRKETCYMKQGLSRQISCCTKYFVILILYIILLIINFKTTSVLLLIALTVGIIDSLAFLAFSCKKQDSKTASP